MSTARLLSLLLLAGAAAQAATPHCPAAPKQVWQRFLSADCATCWQAAAEAAPPQDAWALDWIVPSAQGDAAPLALAARPEADARAQRAGSLAADQTLVQRDALRAQGPRLQVLAGPAWNGYFGLQLTVRGAALPPGSTGWLALVEQIDAGSEGSALERRLVRTVAGPLPLEGLAPRKPVQHLRALRVGEGAQPQRLVGIGWVESADGHVLAIAREPCTTR